MFRALMIVYWHHFIARNRRSYLGPARGSEIPKSEVTRNTRVLVLRGDSEPVGIMVDNVTSVVRLSQREIEPKPKAMQREMGDVIEGVGRLGQRVLIVLDASAVIEVLER